MRETVPSFLYSTAASLGGTGGGGMGLCSEAVGDAIEDADTLGRGVKER